jgi:hypothetical protein
VPRIFRFSAPATAAGLPLVPPDGVTAYAQINNDGTNPLRLYFTKQDFDADAAFLGTDGWIELAASTGFWEGPAELGTGYEGTKGLWLRGRIGTATGQVIWYYRRG